MHFEYSIVPEAVGTQFGTQLAGKDILYLDGWNGYGIGIYYQSCPIIYPICFIYNRRAPCNGPYGMLFAYPQITLGRIQW